MTEKLQQVIKRELEKLPKETQVVINATDWPALVEQIAKKHMLAESEINDLQVQTLLVLIGLRNADIFDTEIENEVGLSKNEAEKIATEVFEKIFTPIAEKLEENIKKSIQGKKTTLEQDLNFILSGGDYSVFIEQYNRTNEVEKTDKLLGSSNILTTKDKLIN